VNCTKTAFSALTLFDGQQEGHLACKETYRAVGCYSQYDRHLVGKQDLNCVEELLCCRVKLDQSAYENVRIIINLKTKRTQVISQRQTFGSKQLRWDEMGCD